MNSWKTIYNGDKPSPATRKIAEQFPNISEHLSVLDYGAGKGRNSKYLFEKGFVVMAYDKYKDKIDNRVFPLYDTLKDIKDLYWDIVLCSYVINVIEPKERDELIKELFKLKWTYLILETRDETHIVSEARKGKWPLYKDGFMTSRGTFQKGFTLSSMRELLYQNTKSILYTNIYTKSHGNISLKIENLDELHQNFYKRIFENWPKKDDKNG